MGTDVVLTRMRSRVSSLVCACLLALLLACQSGSSAGPLSSGVAQCPAKPYPVHGLFLPYFQAHRGAADLGCPITAAFIQHGLVVQYLAKARLEYHPSNPPRYRIQLGLLGEALGRREPPVPISRVPLVFDSAHRYYPQTGHTLIHPFLDFFDDHGGLDRFGYPLSETFLLRGMLAQDYQRARLTLEKGEIAIADWGREMLTDQTIRPPSPPPIQ
jgi:hypothetical protein